MEITENVMVLLLVVGLCSLFFLFTRKRVVRDYHYIQLGFSEEKIEELKDLREKCGLSNWNDFVNNALTLLVWAIRETNKGRVIASIDEKTKRYKEILLPALMHVRAQKFDEDKELPPADIIPFRPKPESS